MEKYSCPTHRQNNAGEEPTDTRERILDAAELLIIERGYAATSLRAIAQAADVNLAATHYHFGSKFGLLSSIFQRHIRPIDAAREAALEALLQSPDKLQPSSILRAFISPLYTLDRATDLPQIVGCIMGEPQSLIRPLLEKEVGQVAGRYERVLIDVLPELSAEEIKWRFHFFIGGMLHLLRFQAPLGTDPTSLSSSQNTQQFTTGLDQLVKFAAAGFATRTSSP